MVALIATLPTAHGAESLQTIQARRNAGEVPAQESWEAVVRERRFMAEPCRRELSSRSLLRVGSSTFVEPRSARYRSRQTIFAGSGPSD